MSVWTLYQQDGGAQPASWRSPNEGGYCARWVYYGTHHSVLAIAGVRDDVLLAFPRDHVLSVFALRYHQILGPYGAGRLCLNASEDQAAGKWLFALWRLTQCDVQR